MKEITIFDYISDILFNKKKKFVKTELTNFNSFMVQRWCSMSSKDNALILNETYNRWIGTLPDKDVCYKLLLCVIPKQRFKKVAYIKKKDNSLKENTNVVDYSKSKELSQREITQYLNFYNEITVCQDGNNI